MLKEFETLNSQVDLCVDVIFVGKGWFEGYILLPTSKDRTRKNESQKRIRSF